MAGRLGLDRNRDYATTADGCRSEIRVSEPQRRIGVILALGIFICSAYLLATSSPWLLVESALLRGLPLGTLITWAGIVSLPMASFLGFHQFLNRETKPTRVCRSFMICLLLLSTVWGFVAYGLAGNWAFNFSNQTDSFRGGVVAGEIFWVYSKSIVAITVLASAVFLALTLFLKRREFKRKKKKFRFTRNL